MFLIYTFQENHKFKIFSIYNKLNKCSFTPKKLIYRKETSFLKLHTVHYSGYKYIFTVSQHIIFLKSAFNININNHILKEPHTKFAGKCWTVGQ